VDSTVCDYVLADCHKGFTDALEALPRVGAGHGSNSQRTRSRAPRGCTVLYVPARTGLPWPQDAGKPKYVLVQTMAIILEAFSPAVLVSRLLHCLLYWNGGARNADQDLL
jgi:hypothetical protein